MQKDNKLLKMVLGIFLGLLLLYVVIDKTFSSLAVNCKKVDLSKAACECLKTKIAKNIPFTDKVVILVSGVSSERIASYISFVDMLDCAVRAPGFLSDETNHQKQSTVNDEVYQIVLGVRQLLGEYDDFSRIDNSTIFTALAMSNKNPYGGKYVVSVNPSDKHQFIVTIDGLSDSECKTLVTKKWADSVNGATGSCIAGKNNKISIIYSK